MSLALGLGHPLPVALIQNISSICFNPQLFFILNFFRHQTVLVILQSIYYQRKNPKTHRRNTQKPKYKKIRKQSNKKPPHIWITQFPMLACHTVEKYQELLIEILKIYWKTSLISSFSVVTKFSVYSMQNLPCKNKWTPKLKSPGISWCLCLP